MVSCARFSRARPRTPAPGRETRPPGAGPARRCAPAAARTRRSCPARSTRGPRCRESGARHRQGAHRHAGQLQVHQVADALDRADLDLGRKARAHRLGRHVGVHGQHEAGAAQQFGIGDLRHAHALAAVMQRDLHGVLLQHHRQRAAQLGHERPETGLQVVVAVIGQHLGQARGAGIGGQVAGQHQPVAKQPFGMQGRHLARVPQRAGVAVYQRQQQEVGHFGDAAAARLRQPLRQRRSARLQQPGQLAGIAAQRRIGVGGQPGRDVHLVEHHAVVGAALQHPRGAQRHPFVAQLGFGNQPQAQTAQLHQRRLQAHRAGVLDLAFMHAIARQRIRAVFIDHFAGAGAAARQRQHHARIAHGRVDVQRRRPLVGALELERRAVGQHARGARQRQLAQRQRVAIDLQRGVAPAAARGHRGAHAQLRLDMPFELLEMLRPQEHALRPDDLVVQCHMRFKR